MVGKGGDLDNHKHEWKKIVLDQPEITGTYWACPECRTVTIIDSETDEYQTIKEEMEQREEDETLLSVSEFYLVGGPENIEEVIKAQNKKTVEAWREKLASLQNSYDFAITCTQSWADDIKEKEKEIGGLVTAFEEILEVENSRDMYEIAKEVLQKYT